MEGPRPHPKRLQYSTDYNIFLEGPDLHPSAHGGQEVRCRGGAVVKWRADGGRGARDRGVGTERAGQRMGSNLLTKVVDALAKTLITAS